MVMLALCAIVGTMAAKSALPAFMGVGGHECPNNKMSCTTDQTCCPTDDGSNDYMCCGNTNVKASTCCGDGCCTDNESCCVDEQAGAVCCEQQDSYCVQRDTVSSFPSRCCPRWTVGCDAGTVGCCDPAQPYQWTLRSQTLRGAPTLKGTMGTKPLASSPPLSGGRTAYALITAGGRSVSTSLLALTIDVTTGRVLAKKPVTGFDDDVEGAATREFLWDTTRKLFYYLDANFTVNQGIRPVGGRPAFLITVDPVAATWKQQTIKGAVDFPTGFAMVESTGMILMATERYDQAANADGFVFYNVDPATATATAVGQFSRGADESDPSYYAGYHRSCSDDGKTAYRLGYQKVSMQSGPGIGVTPVNGVGSMWKTEQAQGHDFFMTTNKFNNNTFLSLAPRVDATPANSTLYRGLDLIEWSEDGSVFKVLAQLGNAHPPRAYGGGDIGYLADYTTPKKDLWVGLVSIDGTDKYQITDHYGIASFDFGAGASNATVVPLTPRDIAGTWSVSGVGV